MSTKKFDCVELMRSIRDKHRSKYTKDPELRKKRLQAIRKKYGFASKEELLPSN